MITYEVTFRDGESLHLGPFSGRNDAIEKMLETSRESGMVTGWKIRIQDEENGEGDIKNMGTVESIRRSTGYLAMRREEKDRDRKFHRVLALVLAAGAILAAIAWRILF